MKTREFQLDALARARELQNEAAKLHIPVPILSWGYEIKDESGNVIEKGTGKSNSYTRNALNSMAFYIGLADYNICANSFGDGILSRKTADGTVATAKQTYSYFRTGTSNPYLFVGTSTDAESLDSYVLPTSDLTSNDTSVSSTFNSTSRRLITVISRMFINGTGATIDIVESGVGIQGYSSSYLILYIRDVFPAVSVAPGQTLTWTYVTEIAYPNP